jgi:hypothetical protein
MAKYVFIYSPLDLQLPYMKSIDKGVNWNSRAQATQDTARIVELLNIDPPFSFLGIEEEAALIIDDKLRA